MIRSFYVLLLSLALWSLASAQTTIAFGSCNKHDQPQPLWKDIVALSPDLWIWLGDNIYADTGDTTVINKMYAQQKAKPMYAKLCEQSAVLGVWDDHDYGSNNSGKEFEYKDATKAAMLDFLDVPEYAPVRRRSGAYQAYTFGESPTKVKVILLDVRYFRDNIERKNRVYQPNETGTILGSEQWTWFEEELKEPGIDLFIIGSGIQMIPEDHKYEKWANFPNERRRLLNTLTSADLPGVVLLSGDRHIGEISRMQFSNVPYPIVEITSSGLTHAWVGNTDEKNRHRHGGIADELNFGVMRLTPTEEALILDGEIRGKGGNVLESISIAFPNN